MYPLDAINSDNPIVFLAAAALLGMFGGFGLVMGAFVARALRRYMRDEDLEPYRRHGRREDDGKGDREDP